MGFGPVQSANLAGALTLSRTEQIEDWRFLAAFGIEDLGRGDSRRLLDAYLLEELPYLDAVAISAVYGFGKLTADSIVFGIQMVEPTLKHMLALGFNLKRTGAAAPAIVVDNPLNGKHICFTGKMLNGSREEMQERARSLGALVQSSVNSKTDFLVCGENVGAAKVKKAQAAGSNVLSEAEYFNVLQVK